MSTYNPHRHGVGRRMAEALAAALLLSGSMLSGALFVSAPPAIAMPDNDNDGIEDWREQRAVCSDPKLYDTDYDKLSDGKEVELGTNPCHHDPDDDNFPDSNEVQRGTDPFKADTDGDGVNDGDEVFRDLTDPKVPNNGAGQGGGEECPGGLPNDCDADGMFDEDEINGWNENGYRTDPKKADTDGDGVNDGAEDDNGTNPLDSNDN
ncbi:MAG: hypothetical protein ACRDU5_14820 [Mycobacterium sp.]